MKSILKMVIFLLVGFLIGLLIGGLIFVYFKGGSFSEFIDKLSSINEIEILQIIGYMVLWMIVSGIFQIIVHEGGHLVAGLLTGYHFVSFRVFSLTLIKQDGRFQFRRFSIGGTGGQCLMSPPEKPIEQIDTRWYNLGGVLANLLVSVVALLVNSLYDLPMWAGTLMIMLVITGIIVVLLNGLPLKISGIGNDGYNLLHLEKSPLDKKLLCQMLKVNADIQAGVQPKDLPTEFFAPQDKIDWSDGLQANWQMMVIARMENLHQWDEVYGLLSEGIKEKDKILELFYQEMECEMVFVCLVTGRIDEARKTYTSKLQKYAEAYSGTQSSKQRLAYTIALLMENKHEEASKILNMLKKNRQQYLLQGEVDMDIELMDWIMKKTGNTEKT